MNARDFALLAQEAYSAKPDIGDADSASRAILRQTPAGLVVAFPGSDNFECWKTDFDIGLEDVAGVGKIHSGFWQAWQAIQLPVLTAIDGQPVTFVGHSLGAALAIMATVATIIGGNPPVAVYGFEPPRVSPSTNVAKLLMSAKTQVNLYKNGNDIVPDVPLGWYQSGLLQKIGTALMPIPNARDHMMDRVIAALPSGVPA